MSEQHTQDDENFGILIKQLEECKKQEKIKDGKISSFNFTQHLRNGTM